jgi:outer membrane protein TolC
MKKAVFSILGIFIGFCTTAQESFSIREAVKYGIEHHSDVRNAKVGRQDAELQINEIKQSGLPQINGQFSFTSNIIIPKQLLDATNFDPNAKEGDVVEFTFGVPWAGQAGIGINQLIFNAEWLVGLRAADTYRKLADQGIVQSKTTVAENIIKAYYSVLVAEERNDLLELNIARIEELERTTAEMFKQGFVEKIDLNRLAVQKNNLLSELSRVNNLIELSYQLLKFQMSYNIGSDITLTDNLVNQEALALLQIDRKEVNPEDRIEYQLLGTNRQLLELNTERFQKSALPSVSFNGSLGASHSGTKFNPFIHWFPSSSVGIGVNIPIYDSGLRKTKIERNRLDIIKLDNQSERLRSSFDLQNEQANVSLRNGLQNLDIQKRNMELADEVVRVTKIKYQEGVGSNLEVVNAENDLRQSQTNYFAALYDVLVAKVDLDKAQGNLIIE